MIEIVSWLLEMIYYQTDLQSKQPITDTTLINKTVDYPNKQLSNKNSGLLQWLTNKLTIKTANNKNDRSFEQLIIRIVIYRIKTVAYWTDRPSKSNW